MLNEMEKWKTFTLIGERGNEMKIIKLDSRRW